MDTKAHIKTAQRPASAKRGFRQLERVKSDAFRTIGFGLEKVDMSRVHAAGLGRADFSPKAAGLGDLIESILSCRACPTYNMPVIEQVRWTLSGPMLTADVTSDFGAEIDLFGSGKNVPGIAFVETTMAQPGQLQTPTLACAIGFHLEPEPLCFTAQGNAWTHPTVAGTTAPPSPDVFTQNDRANGALNAAIAAGTQVMVPAVYEHGWWANYAAWHMVRGYDLRWKIGQHTNIMDEVLRHTAYMPPSAQEGSASSSQVDIVDFVRQLNEHYDGLGSALDFLKITHVREGSVTVAAANVGVFRPSRAFQVVGATYGGMDLRSMLRGNSEFRQLTVPYLIQAGIPIGLVCQESDSVEAEIMRRYLDISQGQGAGLIPPTIADQANIAALSASGGNIALEQTLDTPPVNVSQAVDEDVALYKGGEFKISMLIKGFEVDGDWAAVLNANPDLRKAVLDECGCNWGGR